MASLRAVTRWDHEVDIAIAGAGLAGCVSAIAAYDEDPSLKVLITEKLDEGMHGGASRCAGQYMYCPPPESFEDLCNYQRALNEPFSIPEPVLQAWARAVTTNRPWIEEMAAAAGLTLNHLYDRPADFPHLPGAHCVEQVYRIGEEAGSGVWRTFRHNVDARGIPVLYETPAYDLVQDPDTLEVHGLLARDRDGKTVAIKARRGVVLCLGSFAANFGMLQEYAGYPAMYTLGCPANTGEGIRMLQKAGADLWHIRGTGHVGGVCPAVKVPDFPSAFFRSHLTSSSWIEIAADDRRYYDEAEDFEATHFKLLKYGQWVDIPLPMALPVHMIFDERTRLGDRLCLDWAGWNAIAEGYKWSPDNAVEIERGWIKRADTLRELAGLIGRDPDAVEAAVARWNAACEAGVDEDHGRDPSRMEPIVGPPYYAMEIVPGVGQAPAGGVRNEHAQVMTPAGEPIPRLYEAGELGSTLANLYQNGSFLTEAIAFGRIAGRHVAALPSWEGAADAVHNGGEA